MKEWVDTVKDGTAVYSEIYFGRFKLTVHHFMSMDYRVWMLTCDGILDNFRLRASNLSEAKCQAEAELRTLLQNALVEIELPLPQGSVD